MSKIDILVSKVEDSLNDLDTSGSNLSFEEKRISEREIIADSIDVISNYRDYVLNRLYPSVSDAEMLKNKDFFNNFVFGKLGIYNTLASGIKDSEETTITHFDMSDLKAINIYELSGESRFNIEKVANDLEVDSRNLQNIVTVLNAKSIPLLVCKAGLGKSYTARKVAPFLFAMFNKKKQTNEGMSYNAGFMYEIPCSGSNFLTLCEGYDAVSNKHKGSLSFIWDLAKENPNNFYYVILDEFADIKDFRATLKNFITDFENENKRPNNLVIIATGNNGIGDSEAGVEKIKIDDGLRTRFYFVFCENIFSDGVKLSEFIDLQLRGMEQSLIDSIKSRISGLIAERKNIKGVVKLPSPRGIKKYCSAARNNYELFEFKDNDSFISSMSNFENILLGEVVKEKVDEY